MSDTADDIQGWFTTDPDRLAAEVEAFAARGLPAQSEQHPDGTVSVTTALPYRGQDETIEVQYPYDYPDRYPLFVARHGLLDRHQGVTLGDLCWSGDPEVDWRPHLLAADIVHVNVRALLDDSAAGPDVVQENEMPIPEPMSAWIGRSGRSVAVPDPFFQRDLTATGGVMRLMRGPAGERSALGTADGIGTADSEVLARYGTAERASRGWWLAVPDDQQAVLFRGAEVALANFVDAELPDVRAHLERDLRQRRRKSRKASRPIGFTFVEEGPEQGQRRRNWAFGTANLPPTGALEVKIDAPAHALTRGERQRRIPELLGLEEAAVVVIGAGSVGSPLVMELAKAGVGLIDVVDDDVMDLNNTVRHALDTWSDGEAKARAVATSAARLNPFIKVHPSRMTVGSVHTGLASSLQLRELIESADVVADTTGSPVVARILQRHCLELGATLVVAGLTSGSHGADIAVFPPDARCWCFDCFELYQDPTDGRVPQPRAGGFPLMTPRGCSHPAFTGSGFDATALAAQSARVVVQATGKTAYPPSRFDWTVMNFRGAEPVQSGRLDPHPRCSRSHGR